jgi:hypothetical protein
MGVAASVVGLTIAMPLASTAVPLVMTALIVESSSGSPSGAGIRDFFNAKYLHDGPEIYVNFLTGPFGIWQALAEHPEFAANPANGVLSVGETTNHTVTQTIWVIDKHATNLNGGFGRRSPAFAYDINTNAPMYLLNPFAMANSLVAYLNGNTYVAFDSPDGLPLVAPLRELGVPGNIVADAIEPALTALVDFGYPANAVLANPRGLHAGMNSSARVGLPSPSPQPAVLHLVRDSLKFAPGATAGAPKAHPPKPVPVSVKAAVDHLKNASAANGHAASAKHLAARG